MMFLTSSEESPYKNGFLEKSGKFVDFEKKSVDTYLQVDVQGYVQGFYSGPGLFRSKGKYLPA